MPFKLHVKVDGRETEVHELKDVGHLVVGRDSTAGIIISDRSVSRKHCLVRATTQGVEFVDQESANGLYYDGKLLPRVLVQDGETVILGMAHVLVSKVKSQTGMIPLRDFTSSSGDSSVSSSSGIVSPKSESHSRDHLPAPDPMSMTISELSTERPEYRALQKERLALLVEAGKSLSQSTDLETLLQRIMDHLFQILPVKRAVLALTADGEKFEARVVRPQAETIEVSRLASQGVMKRVAASRRGEIVDDAQRDQALRKNLSIVMGNIRAAICAPLIANNHILGAIYADSPGLARLYTQPDLDFLMAFASIAAVSIENARMLEQLRDDERMKRDLEVAAEVQKGILPNIDFFVEGLEIDWTYMPIREVGGDFYDIINLQDGRVAVVLGDVSGKSVPAALYMARCLSFLRAVVTAYPTPGEVMTRVNALLGTRGEQTMFATCVVMFIDPSSGAISWANAGHNPTLVRVPATGLVTQLEEGGFPLGFDDSTVYDTFEGKLVPGSWLTFYTDGLVDARNVKGEEFGIARINEIIARNVNQPVTVATRTLIKAIEEHTEGSPFRRDDIAIVNIRRLDVRAPNGTGEMTPTL